MCFDHVGKIFFPHVIVLQIIGRVAFVLFSYCAVVGCLYTSDIKKYLTRLLTAFFISQPIYSLVWSKNPQDFWKNLMAFNIFFDLIVIVSLIGALMNKNWILSLAIAIAGSLISNEYGIYGILLAILFYIFHSDKHLALIAIGMYLIAAFFTRNNTVILGIGLNLQGFGVLALPLVFTNTHFHLKINKYFFYIFYPAHLTVIMLIKIL